MFPFVIFSDPGPGNDAVQVRMQGQVLAPSVQDGDHSHPGAQKLGVAAKVPYDAPGRFEQKAVHHFRPVQA